MDIDKENTLRALKDEPLIATRQWWCRLGIHTWTKYSSPVKNTRGVWTYIEQYRTCACCGAVGRRILDKA